MHLKQGEILKIRSFFYYHRRFGCEHAALPIAKCGHGSKKNEGLIVDLGNSDDCAVFFCVKPEDTHEHSIYVIMLYLGDGPFVLSLQQPRSFKFEHFKRAYNVVGLPGTNFLQFLAHAHSHTLFLNHSL